MNKKSTFLLLALLIIGFGCQSVLKETALKAKFVDSVFYSGALDVFFDIEGVERSFRISTENHFFDDAFDNFMIANEDLGAPVASKQTMWYCIRTMGDSILSFKKISKSETCS